MKSLRDWHVYSAIILAGLIIYGKSIFFSYTYLDDTILLVQNQSFIGNISNISKLFTTDVFISSSNPKIYYRPLLNVLFMIEAQAAQDHPLLYHITNILLHIGCTILVYNILKKFQASRVVAGFAALFFCVHPIHASAVAWIPGRNDTLLTIFILGSFLLFLKMIKTDRIAPLTGHIILIFVALLVKETAVMLIPLCIAYLFLVPDKRPSRRTMLLTAVGYSCTLTLWLLMRNMVERSFELNASADSQIYFWIKGLPTLFLYIGKCFFPFQYSVIPNLTDHSLVFGVLSVLLIVGAILVFKRSNTSVIVWGFLWFLLFLVPSMMMAEIFYEHRVYCAFIGLLIALVQFQFIQQIDISKKIIVISLLILLSVLSLLAFFHADNYKNRINFAANAIATAPSMDLSYSCMASLYLDEGNDDAAENVILQGLNRNPRMKLMHRMLGDIYARRHEYALAAKEYEISFQIEPLNLYTYVNYGKLQLEMGNVDEAIGTWKKAVQINPDHLLGYYYLVNCYIYSKNNPDSAMIYVRELQKRGEIVMPELIEAIEQNPMYHRLPY